MNIYTPTYLYIKQHSKTGKMYFGKTTKDPEKYPGSGTHWRRHIKKHGKEHVETLWYCLFFDKEELIKFALMCSEQWNIVESKDWLNKIPENGLDGRCPGESQGPHSEEHKQKISIANIGKRCSDETKLKMSIAANNRPSRSEEHTRKIAVSNIGKTRSDETKLKMSIAHTGKTHSDETKMKLSIVNKGKTLSDETKQKMSSTKRGVQKPVIVCPHCGKSGGISVMKRWHFDNCAMKCYL